MSGDLDIVKAGLVGRMESVCRALLPAGRREGGLWVSHNPLGDDARKTPAFKVRIAGGDVGAWRDWRGGDKGDALGLVAYCLRTDVKGALAWGRDFLGLRAMTREDREAMRRVERERAVRREKDDAAARACKLLDADRLFSCQGEQARDVGPAAVPLGTFALGSSTSAEAHALAYLGTRGIELGALAGLNRRSFRFSPQTEWWKAATWSRDGSGRRWKSDPGPRFPAIHSAMRNRMGIVTCCHVTFLDPVRPAKAPVTPAKLMFGEALGSVIEISTGPSGIPFWKADRDGVIDPLIIAEGIETAASFAGVVPEARIWAAGSLAGVAAAPIDLDCVDWVLFARDNNAGNRQAQQQFDRALAALEGSGKRVVVEASHVGDDFNDLAQGAE